MLVASGVVDAIVIAPFTLRMLPPNEVDGDPTVSELAIVLVPVVDVA